MGRRGWTLAVSLLLLAAMSAVCCTPARAGSPVSLEGAVERPAPVLSPAQGTDEALARVTAGEVAAGRSEQAASCLGEGTACNPLNDHCCPGYYCFGGLVPTCFRTP
jgi:hypothetical protein